MKTSSTLLGVLFSSVLLTTCDEFIIPEYPVCIEDFPADGWQTEVYCHELQSAFEYAQNHHPKIDFVNPQLGFILYMQTIYKTTDGGKTFNIINTNLTCKPGLIDFIDEQKGFCFVYNTEDECVGGAFYKTTDGGATWELLFDDVVSQFYFPNALEFFDALHGFAIIESSYYSSYAIVTSDGGYTWTKSAGHQFYTGDQNVELLNDSTGYALGATGEIFRTTDRGNTWDSVRAGYYGLYDYQILSENIFFASVDDVLKKSVDGGETWTTIDIPYCINTNEIATCERIDYIHFSDEQNGFLIGTGYYLENSDYYEQAATPYTVIYTTTDGGVTWETHIINSFEIESGSFPDLDHGFIWDGIQNLVSISR